MHIRLVQAAMSGDLPHENVLNQVARDIDVYLAKKGPITEFLDAAYARYIAGESIQGDLERFFDEEPELRRLMRGMVFEESLTDLLELCIEEDKLNEDRVEEFRSSVKSHLWITPALKAYVQSQTDDIHKWTAGDASLVPGTDHDLLVEHRFDRGFDTLHEMRIPAGEFFVDAAMRIHMVAKMLDEMAQRDEYVDEDLLDQVDEGAQKLHAVSESIDDVVAAHRDAAGSEAKGDDEDDNPLFGAGFQ